MTGIEILYKEPIMEWNTLSWIFTWVGMGLLILCMILCAINAMTKENKIFSKCTRIGMIIGSLLLISSVIPFPFFKEMTSYKYYCTISDDVNYEKYEIIKRNENLWVITEKEVID